MSLFPKRRADLKTSCSCPDWGDPCKHVAATHYVLGEVLDRDPFLLFELRGKTKEQVLDALHSARGATSKPAAEKRGKAAAASAPMSLEIPTVELGKLDASAYDKPPQELPPLRFRFDQPVTHGAVLQQLGAPATWQGDASPAEVLAPMVRAAAELARRIAMGSSEDGEGAREAERATRKGSAARKSRSVK